MAIYSLVGIGGTGLGPVAAGWIEMNPRLQWRWIQWIHMMSVRSSCFCGSFRLTHTSLQDNGSFITLSNRRHEGNSFDCYFDSAREEIAEGNWRP